MNREGIFSDETDNFVTPAEPSVGDNVSIRIRVQKLCVDRVSLIDFETDEEYSMHKIFSDEFFDYYEVSITMPENFFRYYFKVFNENEYLFCTRVGVSYEIRKDIAFCLIADFKVPEWAKGAIMYQIFVDRFYSGDDTNDVVDDEYIYLGVPTRRIADWHEYPSTFDVGYFYGGDLQGVWDKLDYLQDLGVEVIYFNPLFVSPSNHKYDTQDYSHIDPHYGKIVVDGGEVLGEEETTNVNATKYIIRSTSKENLDASDAFFADFMHEVHKRGMKVIMDGVFNHCGSFNKWMDREKLYSRSKDEYEPGAYESKDSPYNLFFEFFDERDEAWPDNKSYDGWWGNETLPKLYYETSNRLRKEILGVVQKWLLPPYNIDGWRLDVAADLGHSPEFNHKFWKKFREVVKETNPEAIIIAEHYGDPSSWLDGKQWDTIMNYDAFMEPISWFLTGLEKHSDRKDMSLLGNGKVFFDMLLYAKAKMPMQSYMTSMNELSNHDHSRFLTRTNQIVGRLNTMGSEKAAEDIDVPVFRQAILMQMTLQGAPTIYYGDEAGQVGWTDPDNRRTYPWGHEDFELLEYHRYMNIIHKKNLALKKGSLIPVVAEQDLIIYARNFMTDICLIVVYTGEETKKILIPTWLAGFRKQQKIRRLIYTSSKGYNVGVKIFNIKDGLLEFECDSKSAVVFAT